MGFGCECRTIAVQDEPLDGSGKAILTVAIRHEIRCALHLWTGIARRDAEAAPPKHCNVIAAVADGSHFCRWNG